MVHSFPHDALPICIIRPRPGGGITSAHARLLTSYGHLETDWRLEDGVFKLKVTIPPNTSSIICLPSNPSSLIHCDDVPVESVAGVRVLSKDQSEVRLAIEAGIYQFKVS